MLVGNYGRNTLDCNTKLHPPHITRMLSELVGLQDKSYKLETFINDSLFGLKVVPQEQVLLRKQLKHMKAYAKILVQRLEIHNVQL